MVREILAPEETTDPSLFLAGSITGAADWQRELVLAIERCGVERLTIFNPRRPDFDVSKPEETDRQIRWEYHHLRRADAISFWFAPETLAPIVLFEFGAHAHGTHKPIFVGVHPNYKRIRDVEVQCGLVRPEVVIVYGLDALARQVSDWSRSFAS